MGIGGVVGAFRDEHIGNGFGLRTDELQATFSFVIEDVHCVIDPLT